MWFSSRLRAHLGLCLWALIVGSSFSLVSLLTAGLPLLSLTTLRFVIALIVLLPFVPARDRVLPGLASAGLSLVLGACLAGFFTAMFRAAATTSGQLMSALYVTVPLITWGLGQFAGYRQQGLRLPLLLVLGAAGALLLALAGRSGSTTQAPQWSGALVFLAGCVATAGYPVISRWGLDRGLLPTNTTTRTVYSLAGGASLTGAVALTSEPVHALLLMTGMDLAVVGYLGIFSTGLTFWLSQFATAQLLPGEVKSYSYLVPLVSVGLMLWLGNSTADWQALPGVVLVLSALALLMRSPQSPSSPVGMAIPHAIQDKAIHPLPVRGAKI